MVKDLIIIFLGCCASHCVIWFIYHLFFRKISEDDIFIGSEFDRDVYHLTKILKLIELRSFIWIDEYVSLKDELDRLKKIKITPSGYLNHFGAIDQLENNLMFYFLKFKKGVR